ncbi:E3 ubiquitin-protein ligase MYLIP-like [Saccoglossus kowalevskii]
MWCFVKRQDAVVEDIVVAPRALGEKCLDTICQRLGIVEKEYFGLRYTGKKGDILWLNLRNPLRDQLPNLPPYRMQFLVKYFVNPEHIIQEETRYQYYLQLKSQLMEGRFTQINRHQVIILTSLLAQIEFGDHVEGHTRYPTYIPNWENIDRAVVSQHARLKGLDESTARRNFLVEMSKLSEYGMEIHSAWAFNRDKDPVEICIKEDCVKIMGSNGTTVLQNYSFNNIRRVTCQNKHLVLEVCRDSVAKTTEKRRYQMRSKVAAMAAYRCFIEYFTFYRRTSVEEWILKSGSKDRVFSSILSRLRQDSVIYNFDVTLTQHEVIDKVKRQLEQRRDDVVLTPVGTQEQSDIRRYERRTERMSVKAGFHEPTRRQLRHQRCRQRNHRREAERRVMLQNNNAVDDEQARNLGTYRRGRSLSEGNLLQAVDSENDENSNLRQEFSQGDRVRRCTSTADLLDHIDDELLSYTPAIDTRHRSQSSVLRRELRNIHESLVCKICMDEKMNTTFCPCGHMVCCSTCAGQCSECPICRMKIERIQTVYMQ